MRVQNLSLVHLIRRPQERFHEERHPLLLLLHGIGSNEEDLFGLGQYLDERLLIASARAPLSLGPNSYGWFDIEFTPRGMIANMAQAGKSLELLAKFLDELIEIYGVDERRVYVGGFSQGAMMSLALAVTRSQKIAGVVAMSGRFPSQVLEQNPVKDKLKGMKMLVTHGIYDQVLPIEYGREARRILERLEAQLTYKEYAMGHEVNMECLQDASAWLSAAIDANQ